MFVFVNKNSWLLLGWNEGTCVCAREFMYSRPITGGTSRVEGKQNSLFPVGPVIKSFFLYFPTDKNGKKKTPKKRFCFTPLA